MTDKVAMKGRQITGTCEAQNITANLEQPHVHGKKHENWHKNPYIG